MKTKYGDYWKNKSNDWYHDNFNKIPLLSSRFVEYLNKHKDWKTVLEIGCGSGIYPIEFPELFRNKEYTGIDLSERGINYARTHSHFKFIYGDFLKMNTEQKFDLVFSHSAIDHIYDIELFLTKIVLVCKKYAYISAYNGYHPKLKKHEMTYRLERSNYLNRLSPTEIEKTLFNTGLSSKNFLIHPVEINYKVSNIKHSTIIEIKK